jgi:hypothetical protein
MFGNMWKMDNLGAGNTQKQRGNPNWKKGGPSPNPAGRTPGVLDKRTRVTQALLDDAQDVVRVVIDAALGGDVQAASLVLSRVAPALKGQYEKVKFDFDATAPLTRQIEQVLKAIADGDVAPDTGKQIIESISVLSGIKQIDELESRLKALETS